jgi:hypothetical protein
MIIPGLATDLAGFVVLAVIWTVQRLRASKKQPFPDGSIL